MRGAGPKVIDVRVSEDAEDPRAETSRIVELVRRGERSAHGLLNEVRAVGARERARERRELAQQREHLIGETIAAHPR